MLKVIALTTRKRGLSMEDYKQYYETRHAVLARELVPQLIGYKRNFIDRDDPFSAPGIAGLDFDAITELTFRDRAAFEASLVFLSDPVIAQRLAEDEANFQDRSKTRMFVVDERCSKIE